MTSRVESMVTRASSSFLRLACLTSDSSPRISRTRALRMAGLVLLAVSLPAGLRVAAETEQRGKAAKPLVRLDSPRNIDLTYTGADGAAEALKGGSATPTALAAADFNADGAVDVVAGYSTKEGGVLTLLLGNQDAFAPADRTLYEKAMRGNVPPTFQTKASTYALPEAPELLATGDFNRDGKEDVLVAARGGHLYLLAGDGKGGLLAPQMVSLSGSVRALAATGDGHVAVSLDGGSGPELRILTPSAAGIVAGASFPLPAQGDSVAWGTLGGGLDVAVSAGSHVEIVYGALTSKPQTETVDLSFKAAALELGNFIWDRDGRLEISVLANDGSISILQHGTLDTRPLTPADVPGRRKAMMEKGKQPLDPTSLGHWSVAKKLPYAGPAYASPVSHSAFNSPRLAASESEDLMVLDGQRNQLSILDTSGKTVQPRADVAFSGAPIAALALPRKIDSRRDTVVLIAGRSKPMVFTSDADPTYNVTTTTDEDTNSACTDPSVTSGNGTDGKLSLREAICEANNSGAGTYTISVPAGTYSLTSLETGEIYVGLFSGQNMNLVGAGAGTTTIQQTDGVDRIFEVDPNVSGDVPFAISNVTLSGGNCSNDDGTDTPPADCSLGGGAVLSGGIGGDSLTLTDTVFSNNNAPDVSGGGDTGGAVILGGPGMTITSSTFTGNTAPQGRGGAVWFGNEGASAEGNLTVTNSTFTSNTVTSAAFSEGGAIYATPATGFSVIVQGSTFTGNSAPGTGGESGNGGAIDVTGTATVSDSRFSGNTAAAGGGFYEFNGTATIIDNWWGCNAGPGATGCDTVGSANSSTLTDSPWLVMTTFSASPTQIAVGGTSTLTAIIDSDSNGNTGVSVPDGTPATFNGGPLGTASPSPSDFSGGTATSTFTAGSSPGTATVSATVDNQTLTASINIIGPPVLAVSKSHIGNFTQGSTAVWTVQVSNIAGSAAAATSGQVTLVDTLPAGYTLASFSGSGWSCAGAGVTVTCHSSQVVAGAGSLFSALQLTANVPASSPTLVTNHVVVYGGGSTTQTGPGNGATSFDTATVAQVPASVTINNGGGTQSAILGAGFGTALSVTVTDANSVVIPGYPVIFTANAGGSGQSGTFSNSTGTITIPTIASGIANAGTFTANLKTGSYTVTAAAGGAAATFNLTNLAHSSTTIASLTSTTATIDVFGFGFTAPSGQLAFTDTTSGTPVSGPVTLNTVTATTALTPQATTSTGADSLPDWTTLGEINGDGKLDLITSLYNTNSVSVQLGNGDGTFQTATTILIAAGFGPAECHLVSLRGNGTLDLIVGSFNTNKIAVLLGNGNGTFQPPVLYTVGSSGNTPTSLTTGDFDHNGDLDVAVADTADNTVSILLGDGSGALTVQAPAISVGREPEAVRAGDFNGDGFSDLAVANYRDGTVTTLLNNKNGTFTATTISVGSGAGSGPQALAMTGSGSSLQLAVANYLNNTVSVLKSNGDGTFGAQTIMPVGRGPDDLTFVDFNGDGVQDLVVSNYLDGSVDLLLGSSGGSYTLTGPFTVGNNPYSAAVGDLDGDGTPDLVVSNCFSNNTGVLRAGTQISVSYSGLGLVPGDILQAAYTPDGTSKYGPSTSAGATAP
jgi:trimeric autotransporter adhesin